jgi:nucleoside-diphosphate-sugar epimerase
LDTYAGIRKTSSTVYLKDKRIQFAYLNFEDPSSIAALLSREKFDYIIHNAGLTRAPKDSDYFRVNAEYTLNLAQLAMDRIPGLQKFVFISSLESHGSADQTPHGVVDQRTIPQPRTIYGKSKLRAEKEIKSLDELPYIILRPTGVFGPGEKDFFAVFRSIKKFRFAPIIGTDKIKYSFVYVKDLVRVALDTTLSGIKQKGYFVSDGKIYNIRQFSGAIAKSFDVNPLQMTIPFGVIDFLSASASIYDQFTGKKSLINAEQVEKMKAMSWDCDISPLVNDVDFLPQYTLEEAVRETAQWYMEAGWL